MRKEVRFPDTIGKTIEGFSFGFQSLITFTDGTFVALGVEQYTNGDSELVQMDFDPTVGCLRNAAVKLGVVTQDEIDAKNSEKLALRMARQEAMDRKQYKILKARFGWSEE